MDNDIVLFETKDKQITLSVPVSGETVWLTQDQMSELFDTARSSIAYHIGNIFKEEELDKDSSVEIFDRSEKNASRPPQYYNLDVIRCFFQRKHREYLSIVWRAGIISVYGRKSGTFTLFYYEEP